MALRFVEEICENNFLREIYDFKTLKLQIAILKFHQKIVNC